MRVSIRPGDRGHPFGGRMNFGGHVQFAAALHRVHRVEEEIKEHLFELVGIGADSIHIGLPGTS